ncbi:hypothetical protein SDC9_52358 [bioreactor metagenome]|uniref:Uncharacterized protein n=1 Tax=bioreactor metagenome TaxID=1076179 RepID=A0A644WVG0_9ZZZZ
MIGNRLFYSNVFGHAEPILINSVDNLFAQPFDQCFSGVKSFNIFYFTGFEIFCNYIECLGFQPQIDVL